MRLLMNRDELVGSGLGRRNEILTEDRLNELAQRYSRLAIRNFTGARFEEYVANPEGLERHVRLLRSGIPDQCVGGRATPCGNQEVCNGH